MTLIERLAQRDSLLDKKEVAAIFSISQKRVHEVIKPINRKISERRERYLPEAVIAILQGRPQPEWTYAEFVSHLPDRPLDDADVAHFLNIPKALVRYLPIAIVMDHGKPRYTRDALASYLSEP